jgi:hypothetical protein
MGNNRRAKIAATATVLGLGALGGVALGTNPGAPVAGQQSSAGGASAAIVTSASGANATTVPAVTLKPRSSVQKPIVTRASGGGLSLGAAIDD